MPLNIGYIPSTHLAGPTLAVPEELPGSTTDIVVAAPKTVSVLYAALSVEKRQDDLGRVVAAHHRGVEAAAKALNERESFALVYRHERRYTPQMRLAEMLEAEPFAEPERREELADQARAELRDPAVVERIASTGLRINELFHSAHRQDRGDPHLHTHLFIDAQVTAADDGRDYPWDTATLPRSLVAVMQAYDVAMAYSLYDLVRGRFRVDDETGRRELEAINAEAVAGFPGTGCVPDERFRQLYAHRALRRENR